MEAGVRMKNLMTAVAKFQAKVVKVAQAMFDTPAENWDDIVNVGLVIFFYKKEPNMFRTTSKEYACYR